jgi:hypothetical protein
VRNQSSAEPTTQQSQAALQFRQGKRKEAKPAIHTAEIRTFAPGNKDHRSRASGFVTLYLLDISAFHKVASLQADDPPSAT